MLEEEEGDEDGEEEGDGEVLVERAHCGPATGEGKERSHEELETSTDIHLRWEGQVSFFPKFVFLMF